MLSVEDKWKSETLDEVFKALALSPELSERLVYKGARVLRLLLNEITRASFDIDANLVIAANASVGKDDLEHIRTLAEDAITTHFESQQPVRYALLRSTIRNRRTKGEHPRGWNVYWLNLEVRDMAAHDYLGPASALRIDIAAPELLSEHSIGTIPLNGRPIQAVTLERMAGEKLRAFISSLPAYRNKIREKRIHDPRARDLYDLARIRRKRPLEERVFWQISGQEFYLACQSRCIDCEGIRTFKERWDQTQEIYRSDPTIPGDVPFTEAENTLEQVVAFLGEMRQIPFAFELPEIG